MPTAKRNVIPLKYQAGQESVLDTPATSIIRAILNLSGGNDPAGQIMGVTSPMMAIRPVKSMIEKSLSPRIGRDMIRMIEDRYGYEDAMKRLAEQMERNYSSPLSAFEAEFGMPRKLNR